MFDFYLQLICVLYCLPGVSNPIVDTDEETLKLTCEGPCEPCSQSNERHTAVNNWRRSSCLTELCGEWSVIVVHTTTSYGEVEQVCRLTESLQDSSSWIAKLFKELFDLWGKYNGRDDQTVEGKDYHKDKKDFIKFLFQQLSRPLKDDNFANILRDFVKNGGLANLGIPEKDLDTITMLCGITP
jgi:hypothetical protein